MAPNGHRLIVITRGVLVTLPARFAPMLIKNQKGLEESFNALQRTRRERRGCNRRLPCAGSLSLGR
jgi:hypothetical protein